MVAPASERGQRLRRFQSLHMGEVEVEVSWMVPVMQRKEKREARSEKRRDTGQDCHASRFSKGFSRLEGLELGLSAFGARDSIIGLLGVMQDT